MKAVAVDIEPRQAFDNARVETFIGDQANRDQSKVYGVERDAANTTLRRVEGLKGMTG